MSTLLTTAISDVYADHIEVRGADLCRDLIGKVGFTEYFAHLQEETERNLGFKLSKAVERQVVYERS